MPTLHMIHGFAGAGKTTFAKKLELETGAVRFTPDEWMIALHGVNPPVERFTELERNIHALIWQLAVRILEKGVDVILDFGFWKRSDRDRVRGFAAEAGYALRLYNLQAPDSVLRQRILDRTSLMPAGALFIDENAIDDFIKRFEPLDPATEPHLLIKTA